MSLQIFSLEHHRHGLPVVEQAAANVDGVAERIAHHDGVRGVVLLHTCNRVELVLEVDDAGLAIPSLLRAHFGAEFPWRIYRGEQALDHIFRVTAGLESMVMGEREIAGQYRRALQEAQAGGHASLAISTAIEEALRTSKKVASHTHLDGAGRSVVSVGLDLLTVDDWAESRALLVGTGSYAGAVVAALKARGVRSIGVHSATGRAASFADAHAIDPVDDLADALATADIVVTCRGRGAVIGPDDVRAGMKLLDLALVRDVDRAVEAVTGVQVVSLETVQLNVDPKYDGDLATAERLIDAGRTAALTKIRARVVDPAVTSLRETVMHLVEEETDRLPNRPLTREDAARALERLAVRLLHIPSARAREAAQLGRTNEYLIAMHELYGIGEPLAAHAVEEGRCPVTGLGMDDVASQKSQRTIAS